MKRRRRTRWTDEETVHFWIGLSMLVYIVITVWMIVEMKL